MVTKAILHPAKAAAMCTACRDYAHPPPLYASAKPVFKMDCATDNISYVPKVRWHINELSGVKGLS